MLGTLGRTTVLAETRQGQDEIQKLSLGPPWLLRRGLPLVDGRRDVQALATFVPGQDVTQMPAASMSLECVAVVSRPAPAPADVRPEAAPGNAAEPLAGQSPTASRSAEQTEMARHFMIDTIRRMREQSSLLMLVKQPFDSPDSRPLRSCFTDRETAIGSSWMGARRLPGLRKKLFEVL
ncbi:MAG: hypothetical protein OEU93_01490 [Rubrivivax sp.]|nr:hypothetical protein [Rubrivivax sp.]MDH5338897.1 hypothetical protein [Rubrivivax sp.]